jgi:hypothetical protein
LAQQSEVVELLSNIGVLGAEDLVMTRDDKISDKL